MFNLKFFLGSILLADITVTKKNMQINFQLTLYFVDHAELSKNDNGADP